MKDRSGVTLGRDGGFARRLMIDGRVVNADNNAQSAQRSRPSRTVVVDDTGIGSLFEQLSPEQGLLPGAFGSSSGALDGRPRINSSRLSSLTNGSALELTR